MKTFCINKRHSTFTVKIFVFIGNFFCNICIDLRKRDEEMNKKNQKAFFNYVLEIKQFTAYFMSNFFIFKYTSIVYEKTFSKGLAQK